MQPVIGIQDNFEGLYRAKGDDIHTARYRKAIQNSLLGDFLEGFISRPPPTTLGEKIQVKLRESYIKQHQYIQQAKVKKSPN